MMKGLKLLKNAGFQVHGAFIIGSPTEKPEEVWKNIEFAAEAPIDIPVVSILNPYEGTAIYNRAKEMGILKEERHQLNKGTRLKLEYLPERKLQFYFSSFRFMVLFMRQVRRLPRFIEMPVKKMVRFIYCCVPLPYRFLSWIHDTFFPEYILTRIYRKLETNLIPARLGSLDLH